MEFRVWLLGDLATRGAPGVIILSSRREPTKLRWTPAPGRQDALNDGGLPSSHTVGRILILPRFSKRILHPTLLLLSLSQWLKVARVSFRNAMGLNFIILRIQRRLLNSETSLVGVIHPLKD